MRVKSSGKVVDMGRRGAGGTAAQKGLAADGDGEAVDGLAGGVERLEQQIFVANVAGVETEVALEGCDEVVEAVCFSQTLSVDLLCNLGDRVVHGFECGE